MQRKAKLNHAFLHKKYNDSYKKETYKRRKLDMEEAIVECKDDTKIRINHYALENYNESCSALSNQDITGVHNYGNAMRAEPDLEDILERPDTVVMEEADKEVMPDVTHKGYDFYSP